MDIIKKALTRKVSVGRGKRKQVVELEPSDRLVLAVQFVMAMIVCLSALEVVHLAVLHTWNSEIFSFITGLIGSVVGVLLDRQLQN